MHKNDTRAAACFLAAGLILTFLATPLAAAELGTGKLANGRLAGIEDPAAALFASPDFWEALGAPNKSLDDVLDKVYALEHYVPVGDSQTIYMTEFFTLRSWLRWPRRAMFLLTGPEFRGSFETIPVEGYDVHNMAARRGFFVYAVDYLGVGESTIPPDGSTINYLTQVDPIRAVIDIVRLFRAVPRVDLVGGGYGGEIASQLAADPERVRSVVLSTMFYKNLKPEILDFLSPQLEAFLRSHADGYWEPFFLPLTLQASTDQDLIDYVFATQAGTYPTGPTLEYFDFGLPIFDPTVARVPALIVEAELDPFPAPGDMAELAADWGGDEPLGQLLTIPGAFHVPRIEAPEIAQQFFDALFDFIDP